MPRTLSEIDDMEHDMRMLKYAISVSLYMYLLVDTAAGILISRGFPNIGQLYKILVVFMMLVYVISKKTNAMVIISFLFALLFLIPAHFILSDFADSTQSLQILFKTISVFVFYEYFQTKIQIKEIDKIFKINYIVFILNILFGLLGFAKGTYSYDEKSVGTTGFFYAGNEVTFTFVCLTFWFIIRVNIKPYLKYAISLVLSVIIGTKSGMLATLLLIIIDIYYSSKPKNRPKIIVVSLIGIAALSLFVYTFLQDNLLVRMISFKLKRNFRGDFPILNALLSGRIERIPIINEIYEQNFSAVIFIFGLGFPISIKNIEMDFFEYFYYFGFLAFLLLTVFYLTVVYKAYVRHNRKQMLFNCICIMISFLAGHVVYSVMGGIFFAMLNSNSYEETRMPAKADSLKRMLRIVFKRNVAAI